MSCCIILPAQAKSNAMDKITRLKDAYREHIQSVNAKVITWRDGKSMLLDDPTNKKTTLDKSSLRNQLNDAVYPKGKPANYPLFNPVNDPGRTRHTPFFQKMYGQSENQVKEKLVTIYWMQKVFGNKYPLLVTTVNSVDKKLSLISNELEILVQAHPEFLKFLDHPGGTFQWRPIKNTDRLSLHSFGIAIDINEDLSNYWQDDLEHANQPILESAKLTYKNTIPWEIVAIFEKHGFIWGGKWYHFDTMHFEYRPEM
jgi:peptidoglycan L-alanyl-D-glutamate endopeptidase CwlK